MAKFRKIVQPILSQSYEYDGKNGLKIWSIQARNLGENSVMVFDEIDELGVGETKTYTLPPGGYFDDPDNFTFKFTIKAADDTAPFTSKVLLTIIAIDEN